MHVINFYSIQINLILSRRYEWFIFKYIRSATMIPKQPVNLVLSPHAWLVQVHTFAAKYIYTKISFQL